MPPSSVDWELLGEDPAPGDPEAFFSLATDFAQVASDAEDAYGQLTRLRDQVDDQVWRGEAAQGFKERAGGSVLKDLRKLFESYHRAAEGTRAYALTLTELRHRAHRALKELQGARAEEQSAELARHDATAASPGTLTAAQDQAIEAARQRAGDARNRAEQIREDRRHAEAKLLSSLEEASDLGIHNRSGWQKLGGSLGSFAKGAWEGTTGMVSFAYGLSPHRLLYDPGGYLEDLGGMAQGLLYGVTHPVEFAKAASNWDMWLEDPARALGQLVPELVLALATAGGGVAVKGAGATRRVAGKADELAEMSGILRHAARGKGNFGIGSATAARSAELGRAWVGGSHRIARDGKALISADGLRQYRPPSFKPNLGRTQANFESRYRPEGPWQANGHLDITP